MRPGAIRACAACGIAGPLLFAAFVAAGTTMQDGYSSRTEYISALSAQTADDPWLMIAGFAAIGLLTVPFAAALQAGLPPGSRLGPGLVAVAGVGLVATGFLRNDCSDALEPCQAQLREEASWQNTAHDAVSGAAFFCIATSPLPLARRMRRDPEWRALGWYSLGTVPAIVVPMILYGFELAGDWGGAVQRAFVGVALLWVEVVAWRLLVRGRADGEGVHSRHGEQERPRRDARRPLGLP
jgi:hypothetical protein